MSRAAFADWREFKKRLTARLIKRRTLPEAECVQDSDLVHEKEMSGDKDSVTLSQFHELTPLSEALKEEVLSTPETKTSSQTGLFIHTALAESNALVPLSREGEIFRFGDLMRPWLSNLDFKKTEVGSEAYVSGSSWFPEFWLSTPVV